MNNMNVSGINYHLDAVCKKLCKRVRPNGNLIYEKVFENFYGDNIYLKAFQLNIIVDLPWEIDSYEKMVEQLQREVDYLKKQLEEKEKESIEQYKMKRRIELQRCEIEQLESELHQYKNQGKKDKGKNAYKETADPVQIYQDIANGMSKTEVARKYSVSRNTVRKRYEEGRQIIENEVQGK